MNIPLVLRAARLSPLPLRLTLGIIMLVHGHEKTLGESRETFPAFVQSLGVPQGERLGRFVSVLEFIGGLALIAGLFTRLVSVLFTGMFLFILFRMKWSKGLVEGYEFDLALLGGFVSLALLGGGAGSLDEVLRGSPLLRHQEELLRQREAAKQRRVLPWI